MPRNASSAIEYNFTGGFVTQATGLDFPENSCFDQDNCIFSEVGIASRRFGMDYENNFATQTLVNTEKAQTTYYWKNAASDGNVNLVVQQNGGMLYFYNTNTGLSLSSGLSANSIALTSFQSSGSTQVNLDQNECQYSTGLGYLFVTHPFCDPFYVLFNPADGSFTASIITFQIRDLNGIVENVLVDNRPSSLTANHEYNLLNQGWDTTKITTMHTALSSTYPSNADVWWLFNDSTDRFNPATTLASVSAGSTYAPQGYYRLNPWSTARAAVALAQSGVTLSLSGTVDQTSGINRPSCTEFHAGRVWYSGVSAQGYAGLIYFSQIVQQPSDFGLCMGSQDPTTQSSAGFLSSDGGVISIPQAGTIFKIISLGTTLIVFGANGVWAITGSVGIGFSATDYSVSPVGLIRSISGSSYVNIDGSIAWWNNTGINIIQNDPQQGLKISSMTDTKIKDFYLEILDTSKRFARGIYNPRTHTIQWLFKSMGAVGISDTYNFDKILNFNTLIGAWYTWTIPVSTAAVNSITVIEGSGSITGSNNVVDKSGNQVIDQSANNVVTYGFAQTTFTTTTKFLVNASGVYTFAENFNVVYADWTKAVAGGIDFTSFFTTGYRVKTQGERKAQIPYIFTFSDVTDGTNSYVFQTLWDYSNNRNSNRWTQKQTVLHTFDNYDVLRRKLKIRGQGTAAQFKFTSVSGLPFNIIGWSTFDTANAAA